MKKIICIGLIFLMSLSMVACKTEAVAKINDVEITKEEYNKIEEFLYATGYIDKQETNKDDVNQNILSFIIDNKLAFKDASKKGITVTKNEVNNKFKQLKAKINNSAYCKEKLKKAGIDDKFLKNQLEEDLVVAKYKENFTKDIKIKDSEIENYYNKHQSEFNIEKVKASQILISTLDDNNKQVNNSKREKLKEKAQDILKKINNGKKFEDLAKQYSDDKSSGKDGGDLGYFSKDEKNSEFTNQVFDLQIGEVSGIIETSYGFHIVKVTDKKTEKKSLDDSKEQIKKEILNEKYSAHLDKLYKDENVIIK